MSQNYTSPYAKPVQQYKSQTDDYISLEVGGPGKCSTPARPYYNNNGNPNGGSGNFYQNRHRGRGVQQNRFSGGWSNNRHSNSGYGGQWHTPRSGNAAERQWRGGGQRQQNNRQIFKNQNDISAYVHSSMIEDPWKDLVERREAIKRSEINLSASASQSKEALSDSSSREDSENDDLDYKAESAEDKNKVESGNT